MRKHGSAFFARWWAVPISHPQDCVANVCTSQVAPDSQVFSVNHRRLVEGCCVHSNGWAHYLWEDNSLPHEDCNSSLSFCCVCDPTSARRESALRFEAFVFQRWPRLVARSSCGIASRQSAPTADYATSQTQRFWGWSGSVPSHPHVQFDCSAPALADERRRLTQYAKTRHNLQSLSLRPSNWLDVLNCCTSRLSAGTAGAIMFVVTAR